MFKLASRTLLVSLIALCLSCGAGTGASKPNSTEPTVFQNPNLAIESDSQPVITDNLSFSVQSTRHLEADGSDRGFSAYELIRAFGGPNPIESPDLYSQNHPEIDHITEAYDTEVGNHFVFTSHRDIDRDRDRYSITDRQRNEIKTYASSEDAVKGYENETMVFTWMFKIEHGMEVSKNFSHFFQLKAVGGEDGQPVVSFTGNERAGEDGLEVRHIWEEDGNILERVDWDQVTGEWLVAYVRATFSDSGTLRVILTRLRDNQIIFDIDEMQIDMWRGISDEHFVRPKWGIYRSLLDSENLRAEEETVRFANFEVSKVQLDQ